MYNPKGTGVITKDYLDYVVKNPNKSTRCILRLYENEVAYANNQYVEISGDNYLKALEYNSSVNSNEYINFGDVCSAEIKFDLMARGYRNLEERAFISKLREYAVICPYFLQTGRWNNFDKFFTRGTVCVTFKDIVEETYEGVMYAKDNLDESLGYVVYEATKNSYEYVGVYYINKDRQILEIPAESNAEYFQCFPLGKFYLTEISTSDYYANIAVTAYDALGFADVFVKDIDDVAPIREFSTPEGLINYFLWQNGLVDYDEVTKTYTKNFSQYIAEEFTERKGISTIVENNQIIYQYKTTEDDTVRTLLSYIASKHSCNYVVNRAGRLQRKKYDIAQYNTGSVVLKDYLIGENDVKSIQRSGLPFLEGTIPIDDATVSWKIENEEGETDYSYTYGSSSSGINITYPHIPSGVYSSFHSSLQSKNAIVELYKPFNKQFHMIDSNGQPSALADVVEKIEPMDITPPERADSPESTLYIVPILPRGFQGYRYIDKVRHNVLVIPFRYTPAEVNWDGDLCLDCGDIIYVNEISLEDDQGRPIGYFKNQIPIMSMNIKYDGGITQTITSKGVSSSNIALNQSNNGASSLNAQVSQTYSLINNSIKKVAKREGDTNTGMTVLVDGSADDVTDSLVISELSSGGSGNWITQGNVIKVNNEGVFRSTNGYRPELSTDEQNNKYKKIIGFTNESFGTNKILWSGNYSMSSSDTTIKLSQKVSEQLNGIVLIFSLYENGQINDYDFISHFVPKELIKQMNGKGNTFYCSANNFRAISNKYLYIYDDSIRGNENNKLTGTRNGITFNNDAFHLRYVIGV